MNALHPTLHSPVDRPFVRPAGTMGFPAVRLHSLRRMVLVMVVVVVQVLLVLGVVASTLGLGYEDGARVGPGRVPDPAPAPAGASRGGSALESA
jgi:hypothetical protein